jgi:hypothetical protein
MQNWRFALARHDIELRDWYESDPDVAEVELPDINCCLPEMIK